jgi:signal transduction histidine kinase
VAAGKGEDMAWISRKTYEHLEEMLDAAIAEEFEESAYDESEMSRLETKWKRFLSASALSADNVKKEHLAVQEMVSDISHQVKTPIANLRLYGEILQERLEGENKALAQRLMEQTELLDFLIQSLVKISRLESGTIQVLPKKQHLCPLLEAVIKRGEEKQKKRNIRLLKTGWDAELSARFDRKWTEEAVYNILDNALKYTKGSSTVKIHVKPYEFFVCVEIEDEGPGVILDEVPRLFDRFYRSPQMKDREGVGLGLFLSREILKKQKGYIKVKNGEKGACFQIYLPV